MTRTIERSYVLSEREIREAILAYLRVKDLPVPNYVGNTPTCKWINGPDGAVEVSWTEKDAVE